MYDIRQFKPALYALILLGITGFALAAEVPGLWLIAVAGTVVNAWLIRSGRFRPMPRLLANLLTLVMAACLLLLWLQNTIPKVVLVGELLLMLQLVKLYEQRSNRDYAQLLVLSLLIMVAGSVSTASLLFGIILVLYLFLSLYCCLLFHLKVEAEEARKLIPVAPEKLSAATLRQDQRFLTRSMRRLTGLISAAAISMAVAVFLFCPRLPTPPLLGAMQFSSSQTLTGFSDNVGFQQVARISQNDAVVAHVTLYHNARRVEGAELLLLRGMTLDRYNGSGADGGAAWSWDRTRDDDYAQFDCDQDEGTRLLYTEAPDRWVQQISLHPTGTDVIFAMPGPVSIRPSRHLTLHYFSADESLHASEPLVRPLSYEVVSRGYVGLAQRFHDAPARGGTVQQSQPAGFPPAGQPLPARRSEIDPKIVQFAHDPAVSGSDASGPLWKQRPPSAAHHPLDGQIARNIEQYLRTHYTYTLDLTDVSRIAGRDPMVAFLYDFKRGHCEYFAGAMTLLCQALGLPARMVIGFRCDDYNAIGGYYIVRQSQAHAWVEVQMPDGVWNEYDPTSGRQTPGTQASMWDTFKHAMDFLEYTWATNVVAYDRSRRDNVVLNMENRLTNTAIQTSDWVSRTQDWLADRQKALRDWLFSADRWYGTYQLLSFLTMLMVTALLAAVGWFIIERWRLRRRARRIGIGTLPSAQKLRLARQLGFYDELLRILERRGIYRAPQLTPMEFSASLSFLPAEAYDSIHRLTRIFYRIRYGGRRLAPPYQRRLALTLVHLEQGLPARRKPAAVAVYLPASENPSR